MQQEIRSHDQLGKVLNAMVVELVDANIHFTLLADLAKARRRYWREFGLSHAFWSLTMRAHQDATLVRLCKTYSQDQRSVNLRTFLETVAANLHFFDADRFRERLRDNPEVDELLKGRRPPTAARVERDLITVRQASERRVRNLMMWRHKYYAHRDPTKILKGIVLSQQYPLSYTDIGWLLHNALRIVNYYSRLYAASVNMRTIVGQDDYQHVLAALRESLRARDARLRKQVRSIPPHARAARPAPTTE